MLKKVAENLEKYKDLLKEQDDEKKELQAFYDKHHDSFYIDHKAAGYYSDWYKDVHDYRPR